MIEEFVKHLSVILTEMCSRVGVEYKGIDFKKHSWTQEQEDSFVEWLANYLRENKDARDTLMQYQTKNKRETLEFAKSFVWNYGWKIREGK